MWATHECYISIHRQRLSLKRYTLRTSEETFFVRHINTWTTYMPCCTPSKSLSFVELVRAYSEWPPSALRPLLELLAITLRELIQTPSKYVSHAFRINVLEPCGIDYSPPVTSCVRAVAPCRFQSAGTASRISASLLPPSCIVSNASGEAHPSTPRSATSTFCILSHPFQSWNSSTYLLSTPQRVLQLLRLPATILLMGTLSSL